MPIKRQFNGSRLNTVIQLRGCSMVVDVLYFRRRNAGFVERQTDVAGRLFAAFLQAHAVVGFAGGSVAGDLTVNVRAPRAGAFQIFDDKEPGAFGQHEAIAVPREGTGSTLRRVIPPRRHDAHELKTAQNERGDRRIDAAGDHRIEHASLNVAKRVSERVGGGCAAGRHDVAEAAKTEAHRHFAGQRADGARGDGIDAALLLLARIVQPVLLFGEVLAASAGADDDADTAQFVAAHGGGIETSVIEGFGNAGGRQWHRAGDVRAILRFDVALLVEFVRYLAGHLHHESRWIKPRDAAHTASAGTRGLPKTFAADSVGTHRTDSCDDDSPHGD